jgi:mitochondrial import receptor subunit TOM40
MPTAYLIDGAKFEMHSGHNENFQTSHSFGWGSAQTPPSYHFGAVYHTPSVVLHGLIDHAQTLQARGQYNWTPVQEKADKKNDEDVSQLTSTSKVQAQLSKTPGMSMAVFEHDHHGSDYTLAAKAVNPSFGGDNLTGIFSLGYLQSVSKTLALGAETTIQKPYPEVQEIATAFALRYAPEPTLLNPVPSLPQGMDSPYMPINPKDPNSVFTTTFAPATGMFQASYWRRLNQRLEVCSDFQALITPSLKGAPGKREGNFLFYVSFCNNWNEIGYYFCYNQSCLGYYWKVVLCTRRENC